MDQTISVLSNENITQLRRLKEVLEEHSYKPKTLKDIDTSISWLPSTLYKLKEDTPQNILIRLFFIGKTVSEFEIAKVFTSDERCAFRGGPIFRDRMAAWLRWIPGSITPPISPLLAR